MHFQFYTVLQHIKYHKSIIPILGKWAKIGIKLMQFQKTAYLLTFYKIMLTQ